MSDATAGSIESRAFNNEFGAVHSDRIALYAKKSWFGGGSLEELPIRHVTSVRMETTRSLPGSIFLLLFGFALLYNGSSAGMMVGLVFIAVALLLLLGWPAVTVNTAGNDLRRMTGTIFQKSAAEAYVAAVKRALFANS